MVSLFGISLVEMTTKFAKLDTSAKAFGGQESRSNHSYHKKTNMNNDLLAVQKLNGIFCKSSDIRNRLSKVGMTKRYYSGARNTRGRIY